MDYQPIVSIIIPTYNHGHLVLEAIESVLAQTYENIEIIVIDDGSKDNTKDVLEPYISQAKINYVYKKNGGLSAARNTGLKIAKGKYVKFLDSDDFLYPRQIELQINQVQGRNDVISVTDSYQLRPNGEMIHVINWVNREDLQLADMVYSNLAAPLVFLVSKQLVEEVGGFDETLNSCEDWDLWIRLVKKGAVIKRVPYIGCCYRISATSMSANLKNMFLTKCKVIEKAHSWLFQERVLSETMIDRVLKINNRLIEEGIVRHMHLKDILPSSIRMTQKLLYKRLKGLFKILFSLLGAVNYIRLKLIFKILRDPEYKYKLLYEADISRYGNWVKNNSSCNIPVVARMIERLNHKGIILMYHRVTKLDHDPWRINVTPEFFDEHMQILKNFGHLTQMRNAGKNLKRISLGQREIVVTFDDGYADNFHHACPILERHNIPATFFIVSGAVDSKKEFWWDELERLVLAARNLPDKFLLNIAGKEYLWPITKIGSAEAVAGVPENGLEVSRAQLHTILWRMMNELSFNEKESILKQVMNWAGMDGIPRLDYLPMTLSELRALATSSLFEIGAHTIFHPMLSKLSVEDQEQEIIRSKKELEEMVRQEIVSFSYPHGDYSNATVDIVKKCGFHYACTVENGPIMRNRDPFRLPRFKVLNWPGEMFKQNLSYWLRQ